MHATRIARVQQRIADAGVDALLVSHLSNVFYLSGFTGTAASLLLTPTAQYFVTDFRYHGRLGTEVTGPWQLLDNSQRLLPRILDELSAKCQLRQLAIEAEHCSVAQFHELHATGRWELASALGWIEDLRMVKDEAELAALRRAAAVGVRVFTGLLPLLQTTTTEADAAAEIEYRARKLGASATSFKPIIASGTRSAQPHAGFTNQTLQPGVPTVIDMGVVVDGYCSDMTRTVFLDDCPSHWRGLYTVVDSARAAGQQALRPGRTGAQVDAMARDIIAAAGYGDCFGHGLGHGVGIQIHESPRLVASEQRELAPGYVVTCEPGIYLPGSGGIRIENMCAVTTDGAESLTPLGTELTVL
jgi:Xaa-Pro aminopeptidase